MANLLEKYGVKEYDKPFSISFIDGFLDCSYRMFMSHFLKIKVKKASFPLVFGEGVHNGFRKINEILQSKSKWLEEGQRGESPLPCDSCPRDCKLDSPERSQAILVKMEDCVIKQILQEKFLDIFNEEFEELALGSMVKSSKEEINEEIMKHKQYAFSGMYETVFKKQPRGKILLTEKWLSCKLGEHEIQGVTDLAIQTKKQIKDEKGEVKEEIIKNVLLDYKTAGQKPSNALPFRQLSMYVHLMESAGIKVDKAGAIFILKKSPPKVVRKNSTPFEQVFLSGVDLSKPEWQEMKDKTLNDLQEDIANIKEQIHCGIFTRNRKSTFCGSCDLRGFCNDTRKLDKLIESGYGPLQQNNEENERLGEEENE